MSFFPADMPRPDPDYDDKGFWKNCSEKRLCFQACGDCGALRHPPTPICHACHSVDVKWTQAPTTGVIYSYNVVHHAGHAAVETVLPYVGALVEFEGCAGVRLITNVTDVDPGMMAIGMRVQLWWDDIGEDMFIPRFKPAGSGNQGEG
jgi:uncharacterized protein